MEREQVNVSPGTVARLVHRVLTSRALPVTAALLAVVLMLPSLNAGWIADDSWARREPVLDCC